MSVGRVTCPLLWAAALGLHSRMEYLSPQGVLLPQVYGKTASPLWFGCGAPLLGSLPPPPLCAGTPVISCFHGSGRRWPWSLMQPGRARTSGLGVPLLQLARWVGWVSPLRPTLGV